jgi:ATP:ADP antiporter, AAA family
VRITWLPSGSDAPASAAAVAAATIIIAFQLAGKATRDALFLSAVGVASLPLMVIAAAVLSALLSAVLARGMARSGPARLVPRLFGLSALLLLAEWALAPYARTATAILVYLHFTSLGAVLVSGFWAIVNERFDPRSARQVIGRITAGGSVGGLLGGLLPERVGVWLPLTAMLPILAILHLLASGLVLGVEHGAPVMDRSGGAEAEPDSVRSAGLVLRTSPYLLALAGLVCLTSAAEGVLDYVFKARASAVTPTGEELLRLFAAFYTATALLGIFLQVTALRRVLGRLGIARSASLLPAGVSAGAVGAFLVPGLIPILLARGIEVVLRSSTFRAAYELLFTPVAPADKRATKLLLDVGSARVGDIAGGALILVVLALAGPGAGEWLLGITLVLSLGALMVARRLHTGYVAALAGSLHRRAGFIEPEDDAGLLLQTVGGFDMSGIRTRAAMFVGTAWQTEPRPREHPAPKPAQTPLAEAVHRGDAETVRGILAQHPVAPDQIEAVIELLAWDAVAPQAIRSLRELAETHTAVLLKRLLDPEEDFAIRRRLVVVLAAARSREAFEGLFRALEDRRFEVRYRAGRVLARMASESPMEVDRQQVLEVVEREIAVEQGVWESRQLIDAMEEEPSPMETELLQDRANRSLEHLFTLLSLILPRDTLRLAFQGLHTEDQQLRGTALEYLETVLPERIWQKLWPLLEPGKTTPVRSARRDQALQELLASRETISLALLEARRRADAVNPRP